MFGEHPGDLFTERAAVELAELLPETATDVDSMRAIPARDRASLNAIKDLVDAVKETTGIAMHVHASTSDRTSVLTLDQARELSDTLVAGNLDLGNGWRFRAVLMGCERGAGSSSSRGQALNTRADSSKTSPPP